MSPLSKLYLIACWSYIISFHITFAILMALNADTSSTLSTLRLLEQPALD